MKSGIFLYALFDRNFPRSTIDIDLLARKISNDSQKLTEVFKEIFSIECDDALRYDLNSLAVKNITEFKEYHGVNVSVFAYLDRTKIQISIDIGFGDVVYPDTVEMDFPVLLEMEVPRINAYSIYSIIAEKFEAIVSLGIANSRYKDFYDIYEIAKKYNLDGNKLKKSIVETFSHRGTDFNDIVAFNDEFIESKNHFEQWNNFIKKKRALDNASFSEILLVLKDVLMPIVNSINNDVDFKKDWDANKECWI